MLTQKDLAAIGKLIDESVDKKLKPVHQKLNKLQKDLTTTINFLDGENLRLRKRVTQIETHLNIT